MKKEYIEIGKIVGTHGVKGMVRIQPWCDDAEFFCKQNTLYFVKNGEATPVYITHSAPHGNVVIAALKGVESMEAADRLCNRVLFLNRKDLNLPNGRYLICDLLDCTVFNADDGKELGTLCDVTKTGANDVWHIKNSRGEFLVPCIDEVVQSVDIDAGKIVIKPLRGIFHED